MAVDDFLEPEVGVAVAATAVIASPRVRGWLRQGLVYGLAAMLIAGDAIAAAARGVERGAQEVAATATNAVQDVAEETPASPAAHASPPAEGEST
ncbi:MAG TPA: hypothetical protein VEZ12_19415 [Herpetosiphonaceae bacterium]|jgi:hypothetical protein|nr:hypothetical protein [Herpetosiphonaceae bacterium]